MKQYKSIFHELDFESHLDSLKEEADFDEVINDFAAKGYEIISSSVIGTRIVILMSRDSKLANME